MKPAGWLERIWPSLPILAALLLTSLLLIAFGTSPAVAFGAILEGVFSTPERMLTALAFWIPLALASVGLLVTFQAGLWNIGIEGQFILGALGASWVALSFQLPAPLQITLEILAGMVGGALWAGVVALFKRWGVHEIFGGLALNNLAIILTNFLIAGPWQPPEGGSFADILTAGWIYELALGKRKRAVNQVLLLSLNAVKYKDKSEPLLFIRSTGEASRYPQFMQVPLVLQMM